MIPNSMWALVQQQPKGKLHWKEVEVPKPQAGQVLVRMEFASINPSDLSTLQGTYVGKPNYPLIAGIEGSGTVVAKGSGILPAMRMGKRVSCTSSPNLGGSWAQYMLTSAMHVVPIPQTISFESAASLIVNPLTALAFIDIAKKHKVKTIVNNAAGGALGKMLIRLAAKNSLNLISIVRNEIQRTDLISHGAKHVLNSSDANYLPQLKALSAKLNAQLYFDAVGGQATADFITSSPAGAKVYLYANLSEQECRFSARTLLQQQKEIHGFYLGQYSSQQNLIKTFSQLNKAKTLLQTDLKTEYATIIPLSQGNEALQSYTNNMSKGKVLLNCNL
jgi:NADPH:quinone reductase-like Zn-dependent oxidoreductase